MNKKLLILLIFLCTLSPSFSWDGDFPPPSISSINFDEYTSNLPDYYGKIIRVADGDTFYVDWYSDKTKGVRVKGIDTPETVDRRKTIQYWGPEASEFAKSKLKPGTIVRLKFEGTILDPFGRLLAYVWYWNGQSWVSWNKEVLLEGMAYVYPDYSFEYPDEFLAYQQEAMKNKKGMWANPELITNDIVRNEEEFKAKSRWYRLRK